MSCRHDLSHPDNSIVASVCVACGTTMNTDMLQIACSHSRTQPWGRGFGILRCTACHLLIYTVTLPAIGWEEIA